MTATEQFSSVAQSCRLFVTPRTAAHQAPMSFTISRTLLRFMSTEWVMPSNHLHSQPQDTAIC